MLREDRLFNKIPLKEHYKIIEYSLNVGEKKAEQIRQASFSEVSDIVSAWGIELVTKEKYALPDMKFLGKRVVLGEKDNLQGRIYCSEYLPRPSTIIVYQNMLDLVTEISAEKGFAIDKKLIRDIFIAHELYHHLEETNKKMVKDYPRIRLVGIGRWQVKVTVNICSEIAAMAFAKAILKTPFFPKIIDLLIQCQRAPGLEETLMSAVSTFHRERTQDHL
jgi:hypothetical protein